MYGFLCAHKFLFLRGKYLEAGNCIVNFIREIAKLFFKWLNHSHQGCMRFQLLHILISTWHCLFLFFFFFLFLFNFSQSNRCILMCGILSKHLGNFGSCKFTWKAWIALWLNLNPVASFLPSWAWASVSLSVKWR